MITRGYTSRSADSVAERHEPWSFGSRRAGTVGPTPGEGSRLECRAAPLSARALRAASDGPRPPLTSEPLQPLGRSRGQAPWPAHTGCAPPNPIPSRRRLWSGVKAWLTANRHRDSARRSSHNLHCRGVLDGLHQGVKLAGLSAKRPAKGACSSLKTETPPRRR